ncbi:MAG: Smr/MutS family protein [Alphaproteobacteria bacterium]|nr:Smr/MutS family protein [Alphaproteobacteria bacterium]
MKRKTTDEERILFKTHIDAVRPFKAATPKPKKLGRDREGGLAAALAPARAKRIEGEVAVAALALRRPEGVVKKILDGNTAEKLKRGQITPGARMDLHGMTEAAAHGALLSFLAGAQARGVRLALVITGIGNPKDQDNAEWMRARHGALKEMVPRWLNEKAFNALVSGSGPAHRRHGGDGALYVYLRKKP